MFGYKPSPWQTRYHLTPHNEVLGAGSAGPGKTVCLVADPLLQVVVDHARMVGDPRLVTRDESSKLFQLVDENRLRRGHSDGRAVHFRRRLPMLRDTLRYARRMFPEVDPEVRFERDNSGTVFAHFTSGYEYQFTHLANPDAWEGHMSNHYTHISWDEANQFEEEQYDQVNTRLRTGDPVLVYMLKIRAMSNPVQATKGMEGMTVKDPFWLRKRFVENAPMGGKTFRKKIVLESGEVKYWSWIYLPARLSDNPDKQFRETYEFNLRAKKKHIRRALLDGDWWVTEGAFFEDEWDEDFNVCHPFRIPDDWPQFRSMDWGYKTRGVVHWYALDPDGNLYVHRELSFTMKKAPEVAEDIRAIEESLGLWKGRRSGIIGPADTQLWEEKGDDGRGRSKAEEMAMKGVMWLPADKRSRARNAEHTSERMKDRRGGVAGLVFFDNCKSAIRTIPGIQTSQMNPNEPAKGGDDHDYDSVSYGCTYASRDPRSIARSRGEVKGAYDWDDDPAPRQHRGAYGYG